MDVVKSEISPWRPHRHYFPRGAGTTFNIYLPLTLAMTQAVMIQAAKHDYALPTPLVQQVLELKPGELGTTMAAGRSDVRGARYPFSIYRICWAYRSGCTRCCVHRGAAEKRASLAAVLVDVIEGTREIVVKNIGPQMARITGVAGHRAPATGRVILILNPVPLALRWASLPTQPRWNAARRPRQSKSALPCSRRWSWWSTIAHCAQDHHPPADARIRARQR